MSAVPPGPWSWEVNPKTNTVELESDGGFTVMDFVRYGMAGAAPRFAVDGLMVRADELLVDVPGREHHSSWFRTINHPTANVIRAAPDLLEALEHMQTCASCAECDWNDCPGGVHALEALAKARGR